MRLLIQQFAHDRIAVAVHRSEYLVPARMVSSGNPKIVAIQRFVDDTDIDALRETVHQGSRDVAGS
jgi:hypothetical protein